MSYTRTLKTQMTDRDTLCEALKNLGHKATKQEAATIRGHYNEKSKEKCDVVLRKEDTKRGADVGFHKASDGTYQLVTDTYVNRDLEGKKMTEFVEGLFVEYNKVKVRKVAKSVGATFLGERKMPNGNIVLRFAKA